MRCHHLLTGAALAAVVSSSVTSYDHSGATQKQLRPWSWAGLRSLWPFRPEAEQENVWESPARVRYEDHVVLRFEYTTVAQEKALRFAVERLFLDVWGFTRNYTDIRLSRRRIAPLMTLLPEDLRNKHSILPLDVDRAVNASFPTNPLTVSDFAKSLHHFSKPHNGKKTKIKHPFNELDDDSFFDEFRQFDVILAWLRLLELMHGKGGLVSLFSVGKSYEGRDIPGLRIGTGSREKAVGPRKVILITGGLHAREWISTSTVNYLAWSFIRSHVKGHDSLMKKILKEFDLVFVPVLNPDGYEYTWSIDRLWRKSRQPTSMSRCHGYDLDHAFGYHWDGAEYQQEPCSESYAGTQPFQAVEATALARWAENQVNRGDKFVAFIDLHSYSQQVLYPYAYSCDVPVPNLENLQEVAYDLAKAMRLSSGESYTVGSACEGAALDSDTDSSHGTRLEAAGGSAMDWFFHDLKARYSFQIKLRDTGGYGFLLPSDKIGPTGREVLAAVRSLGDWLLGNNGMERVSSASEHSSQPGEEAHDSELRRRRAMEFVG